jgi:hypothetical protein
VEDLLVHLEPNRGLQDFVKSIHILTPWNKRKEFLGEEASLDAIKQRCDDSWPYRYAVTTSTWAFDGTGFSCIVPSCTVHSGVERSGAVAPTLPPQS